MKQPPPPPLDDVVAVELLRPDMSWEVKRLKLSYRDFDKRVKSLKRDHQINIVGELKKRRHARSKGEERRRKHKRALKRIWPKQKRFG